MPYCSNCGKELSDNAKFCPSCGNKIKLEVIGVEKKELFKKIEGEYPKQEVETSREISKPKSSAWVWIIVVIILVIAAIFIASMIILFILRNRLCKHKSVAQ